MSLFPTLQQLAPKANLLYSCYPGTLTKQAPSQFAYGASNAPYYVRNGGHCPNDTAVVAWQRFTGTDARTGFAYPDFSPIFAYAGGSNEGFGMYIIDRYYGMGATEDQAAIDSVITIESLTETVRGVPLSVLHTNHLNHGYNGFSSLYLDQSHFTIYRNTAAPGFVDLDTICFDLYMKVPDQLNCLDQTYRFRAIHDFKSTDDFRYIIQFIVADATDAAAFGVTVGTLGLVFSVDNNANGSLDLIEYVRVKNYNVDIPSGYFKATIYWNRAASFSDLTTGRFIYEIEDLDTGEKTTVFDINPTFIDQYNIDHPLACTNQKAGNPPLDCVNRHMGINGSPIQRMFLLANYTGGIVGSDTEFYLAKLDIWDDYPGDLPAV